MSEKPSREEPEQRIHSSGHAEKALKESKHPYRAIVEELPVLICRFLPDGEITFVNKAFCEYFNKTAEALVGSTFLSLIPQVDRETVVANISSLTAASPEQSHEHQIIAAGGKIRWQRWTHRALFDVRGHVIAYLSIGEDITERKQAEEALRESEEKYRLLFECMNEGFALHEIITDEKGRPCDFRFLEMNPTCERLLGLRPAEMIGRRVREIVTESPWIERYGRVALTGTPEHFQDYSTKLERWFEVFAYQPMPGQCAAVFNDITERKRTQEALRESQRKLAALMSNLPGMAYRCLEKQGYPMEFVSQGSVSLTGYTPSQITSRGHPLYGDLIHSDDRRMVWDSVREAVRNGEPFVIEYRIRDKAGKERWVWEQGRAVDKSEDGAIIIEGFILDITKHKRAEEEQENLRTQLAQAQKMESVGRLAGGVAHDYNNMLSVIIGYTELALDKIAPGESIRGDLEEILTAAKRSTDITRQLLAFARQQTIAPKVLDLNDTVESMLKMLRRLIGENINLCWHPKMGLWSAKMDPTQVNQILANLCVNARDAIADVGKITIETDTTTFDEAYCADHPGFVPGDFVMLSVSDDGRGMDKDTLCKVFEPFFTTKELGRGTGLGLSTVYGIVKQNKGFINIYSEPGNGTTIRIYLCRHTGRITQNKTLRAPIIPTGRGEMILVVEDESSTLKLSGRLLNGLGYKALLATSPAEALNLAGAHNGDISLLITDVVMPDMNGRELAQRIQDLYPGLKILFMSGYAASVITHRGVLEKGVHFIQKPFSKKELAQKVRYALETQAPPVANFHPGDRK